MLILFSWTFQFDSEGHQSASGKLISCPLGISGVTVPNKSTDSDSTPARNKPMLQFELSLFSPLGHRPLSMDAMEGAAGTRWPVH
jgi:hypothetical protein